MKILGKYQDMFDNFWGEFQEMLEKLRLFLETSIEIFRKFKYFL